MFSTYLIGGICAMMTIVVLHGPVRSEFRGWNWYRDVDLSKKNFSSLTLTTTALSEVNCLVICTQWITNVAATFDSDTSTCGCYAELNGLQSNPGDHLWKRIPPEYEGSTSLGFYIRLYNNYWYTYEEANDFCVQQGTRLAVVDTTDKINIIIALPGFDITYYYLVAATDNVKEDSFVWSTGSPVSRDAQLWHDYQPNNAGGNQNCLTLKQSKFDDVTCTKDYKFICELI